MTHLLTNAQIQRTFESFDRKSIVSYVNYRPSYKTAQCHIYTLPFPSNVFRNIANNFPGGTYPLVREVLLLDDKPFEYEFFIRLQKLAINNSEAQMDKRQHSEIIEYPHLIVLNLFYAHYDYIELFLLHTKVCLRNKVYVGDIQPRLAMVTRNCTRKNTKCNHSLKLNAVSCKNMLSSRLNNKKIILKSK